MTPSEVQKRIDEIKAKRFDDEAAHSMEDDLHRDVLSAIARGECADPAECARLALTTFEIDFARWYA
jgi:hypothetical protein